MANNIHTKELLDQMVTLVKTDQPLGGGILGLKVAQIANVRWLLLQEDITNFLPALLVWPQSVLPQMQDLVPGDYLIDYFLYGLLIDEFAITEGPLSDKLTKTQALCNVFMTSVTRFTAPEAGVQVAFSVLAEADYTPQEEEPLSNTFNDRIWASRILVQVTTSTARV